MSTTHAAKSGAKVTIRRDTGDNPGGGVCAGIANYLNFDVVFVRIAFIIMTLLTGAAFFVYLVLYFAIPTAKADETVAFPPGSQEERTARISAIVIWLVLTAILMLGGFNTLTTFID